MKFNICAEALIEFKAFVANVDYSYGDNLDMLKREHVGDIKKGIMTEKNDFAVRQTVAEQGYGLDVLVHDTNPLVRLEVARQGYGLDILVNDENWAVCDEVERQLGKFS